MKNVKHRIVTGILAGGLLLNGCAVDASLDGTKDDDVSQGGGKEDRWNAANDPNRFGGTLNFSLAQLPTSGRAAREAWPSTYWATYQDSINVRWNGPTELSPAEKYDRAFNNWTPPSNFTQLRPFTSGETCGPNISDFDASYYTSLGPLARYVSTNLGNASSRDGVDSDDDNHDGNFGGTGDTADECDDNDGVESWWGLCHAWVPASLLEDAPQRPVVYNGVTFNVGDIQALIIAAYNRSNASMIGDRCNLMESPPDHQMNTDIERDEHGRAINVACRDTNPGSFHVIMTNFLGLQQRAIAEDRTFDSQVWNQPLVAWKVDSMDEVTAAAANDLLGTPGATYSYNTTAAKFFHVRSTSTYLTESDASVNAPEPAQYERHDSYDYILELDGAGKIVGGEWIGSSRMRHPDFLWLPQRLSRSSIPNLDIEKVRMLIAMSRESTPPTPGTTAAEFVSTGAAIAIPDNSTTGASSTITVDRALTIGSVQVDLDIAHSYSGDLKVTLTSPGGQSYTVWNNEGGSDDNIVRTINVPGVTGAAQGGWTLRAVDNAAQDTGTIRGWKLRITEGSGNGPTPSANVTIPGAGAMAIPDNSATGVTSEATVPAGTTGTVTVAVNVTHTYSGDLSLVLSHGSQTWKLRDQTGGGADNIVTTFPLTPAPTGNLAGSWSLKVVDHAGQDVGTLNSWSLTFAQ